MTRIGTVGDRLLHSGDENWEAIHLFSIRLEKFQDILWISAKVRQVLNIHASILGVWVKMNTVKKAYNINYGKTQKTLFL